MIMMNDTPKNITSNIKFLICFGGGKMQKAIKVT